MKVAVITHSGQSDFNDFESRINAALRDMAEHGRRVLTQNLAATTTKEGRVFSILTIWYEEAAQPPAAAAPASAEAEG